MQYYHIEYGGEGMWADAVGTFMDVRKRNYDTLGMALKDMYFASYNNPIYTFRVVSIYGYKINGVDC